MGKYIFLYVAALERDPSNLVSKCWFWWVLSDMLTSDLNRGQKVTNFDPRLNSWVKIGGGSVSTFYQLLQKL